MIHARARLVFTYAAVIALLAATSGQASAQFVKYDNFPGPLINPER